MCNFLSAPLAHTMNVCRFYMQGYCRYGNNCRYDHPRPSGRAAGRQPEPFYVSPMVPYAVRYDSPQPLFPPRSSTYNNRSTNYQSHQLPSFTFTTPGVRTTVAHQPASQWREPDRVRYQQPKLPQFSFTSPGKRQPTGGSKDKDDELPMELEATQLSSTSTTVYTYLDSS